MSEGYTRSGITTTEATLLWVRRAALGLVVILTLGGIYSAPACGPLGHDKKASGTVTSVTAQKVCITGTSFMVELSTPDRCYDLRLGKGAALPKPGNRITVHLLRALPATSWHVVSYSKSY
jgi:hypothetical protein